MPRLAIDGDSVEYLDLAAARPGRPAIVLLHEGLGSVEHWRDFPAALAHATGSRCVAYSRVGFGRSSPRASPYPASFIDDEATGMLAALCERLDLDTPVLLGHSTGASMALVHAGDGRWPVAGVVALAPIVFVEESNLLSIRRARDNYPGSRLRDSLARYHENVDAVFYGWADTWLDPAFRSWTLEPSLPRIECPLLAIRGERDEYVSAAQLQRIAERATRCRFIRALNLPDCGHAPHRDHPEVVLSEVGAFIDRIQAADPASR
jgi:pimeloyl-ACP methyl ester carboxylesterase